nr:MAG TPA_asm: hypothetical protein [Caudoviricetes sp.]DAZ43611.1 MAG TPA: hypothetical protein [Caudoviricetes sp.]
MNMRNEGIIQNSVWFLFCWRIIKNETEISEGRIKI